MPQPGGKKIVTLFVKQPVQDRSATGCFKFSLNLTLCVDHRGKRAPTWRQKNRDIVCEATCRR